MDLPALADSRAVNGKYDGGAYRIEIPRKWNGELVLWTHGYTPESGANGLILRTPTHPIRDHLIANGFAWASSSFRCNGYIPGQALVDTVALIDQFVKANDGRAPKRIYMTGASMGGFATLLAMHEMPSHFAGALAMCSAGPELNDFFDEAARSAAAAAGITPARESLQADLLAIRTALGSPPNYTAAGREAANRQIEFSGGPRPFAVEGLAARDQFSANIGLGSSALLRSGPAAPPKYREQMPFSGRIDKPVLSMHTTGDLFVPIFLERSLRKAVTSAGRGQFLVQRIYRAAGHCTFSLEETAAAFDALVSWVRDGVKPDGDDVMADLSDAGRRFTNPIRPGDPGRIVLK